MNIESPFSLIFALFKKIPFSLFDSTVLVALLIFMVTEAKRKLVDSLLMLVATVCIFSLSLILYPYLSHILMEIGRLTKGVADGTSLIIMTLILGIFAWYSKSFAQINTRVELRELSIPFAGSILAVPVALLCSGLIMVTVLSFPADLMMKNKLAGTLVIKPIISFTLSLDGSVQKIFQRDISSALLFLTDSTREPKLKLIIPKTVVMEEELQAKKIREVLQTNKSNQYNNELSHQEILDTIALEMSEMILREGTFSKNLGGEKTVFDLLDARSVPYQNASVLVAISPTADIALQGLARVSEYHTLLSSPEFYSLGTHAVSLGNSGYLYIIVLLG